jgi:thioredoxin 1
MAASKFEIEINRKRCVIVNDQASMKMLHALILVVFLAVAATAADAPYDETADAKLEISQALTLAAASNTPIIIVFGANWCPDCKVLDLAIKNGPSAPLLSRDFKIVKVNVGRFDQNLDVAKSYGVPLAKGVPAVVVISAKNEVLYATQEGELAHAGKMGDKGIYEFFKRVTASAMAKK